MKSQMPSWNHFGFTSPQSQMTHNQSPATSPYASGNAYQSYSTPAMSVQQNTYPMCQDYSHPMMQQGMPQGMPSGIPSGTQSGTQSGIPSGMPSGAQVSSLKQSAMVSPPMASGAQITTYGKSTGVQVPGQLPMEESYIENILRLNLGKLVTIYMTYEQNSEWNAKIFRGKLEASGRDHIIISDPETGTRYLLLMVNLDYITFDGELQYIPPGQAR